MRKNKKLFAILTLVAFMMTLMPVLAFGAGALTAGNITPVADENGVTLDATGIVTCDEATHTEGVTQSAYQWASAEGNIAGETDAAYVATVAGTYTVSFKAKCGNASCAANTDQNMSKSVTVGDADIAAYHKAYAEDQTAGATVTAVVDSENDASANVKVTLTLENALKADYTYDVTVGGESGTITIAAGAESGSTTIAVTKGNSDGAVTVTVKDRASSPATAGSLNVSIKASTALATSAAWTAYKAAPTDADKFATFKAAQAKSPLTGADANKAAVVADCASASIAAAYFTAATEYNDLKTDVTTTNLNNFKTAYAAVTPSKLASFIGVSESTLKQINETSNLETVADLISGGSGGSLNPSDPSANGRGVVGASIIATAESNVSIESAGGAATRFPEQDTNYAEIEVVFRASNNAAALPPSTGTVYVWAEESGKSGQASDALVVNGYSSVDDTDAPTTGTGVYMVNGLTASSTTLKVAFLRGGTYTIKASFDNPLDPAGSANKIINSVAVMSNVSNKSTVTVTGKAQETRKFAVVVDQALNNGTTRIDDFLTDGEKTDNFVTISANTVATSKVTLTLYGAPNEQRNNERSLMSTYPISLSTNSANIELDKTSITTDYKGQASFNIAGIREGEYKVYVTIGDYEATILVKVGATSANNIELIKFPSNPIATDTLVNDYKDIFRFRLTDANGNVVTAGSNNVSYSINGTTKVGGTTPGAGAATDTTPDTEEAKYVSIVKAPEANKVKDADLYLYYPERDKDYYTLRVGNNKAFTAEGDYEIRVVLDNGKSATLNFTVKKFDKAVSLHIEYPTQAVELNSVTERPDIYFLDANKVMKKANNRVTVAAQGYAVAGVIESGENAGVLSVKNDEKYVGQTITVTAASDKENLMASTTLTVADEAREVKLDTNRGQVNANNRVGFKVVDSTGNAVALGNEAIIDVTAVVTNTGDPDAKVSYSVSGGSKVELGEKGTGVINLSANKQTTATVQIMVKVTKNNATQANDNNTGLSTTYYSGTETFTFGAEADKSVVMTIGSKEIVAQNVPVTIDVAPFIQDNRTYVPFRALVEAFGAEVDYNADNNTVTTKLDGKTVVLTVGSTVLTVNDETVTMDVAPFIVDDRVVVPVRFVGEAFGFTVEATQDADTGATASVVFYQK